MPLDIYTKRTITVPSEEHVLPRSLGGKLRGADLIDKATNNQFGHGIDARLDEALRSVRVMLDARNSDGDPPRALSKVRGDDGKDYFVEPGGRPREVPRGRITRLTSGDLQFAATATDGPTLRKMLRRHFKGSDAKLDEIVSKAMTEAIRRRVAPPAMTFDLPLWEAEPYRATAKIAFNLFALGDPKLALSPEFDGIRSYVLTGEVLAHHPVQATAVPEGETLGPLDHLVLIGIQPSGEVLGFVSFFGYLGLVVRLGSALRAAPRRFAYRVDQLAARDRRDAPQDLALTMPSFEEAAARSYEEFRAVVHLQIDRLVPAVHAMHQRNFLGRIMRPHWERLQNRTGEQAALSIAEAHAFSAAVAKDVVAELAPILAEAGLSAADLEEDLRVQLLTQREVGRDG